MDDERAPLLVPGNAEEAAAAVSQPPIWKRKRAIAWSLVAMILAIAAAIFIFVLVRPGSTHGGRRYPGESIVWKPCGEADGKPLECSSIHVPMDQFDATASGDKTFYIPLIRRRGSANATTNILLNPGGPGGSGIGFMKRKGGPIHTIVGEDKFHLLSFDPRGIADSRPRGECFKNSTSRRMLLSAETGEPAQDAKLWSETGNVMRACADNMGDFGPHINTPQTAADMNSILDAVGQDNLYYWGFSYGTALGQTYATLFPDRSERVAVDGVVDDVLWYDELLMATDFVDTGNCFSGFFDECVKAGNKCPLHFVADEKAELQRNVTDFIESLRDEPASVYINSTFFGTIEYKTVMGAVFSAMYAPKSWYLLADNLAQLMQGNGTGALIAWGGLDDSDGDVGAEAGLFVEFNDAPAGTSRWPAKKREVLDIVLPFVEKFLPYSASNVGHYMRRAQWRIPKAHDFRAARHNVTTKHPLLVLSTTYDPICPLVNAKVARESFVGAKLVEVKGYGHCSLAIPSTCAARIVRDFFATGKLPEEDHTKCAAEGPYFISPNDSKTSKLSLQSSSNDGLLEALTMLTDAIKPVRKAFF
ncbi:S33 family peptidase [Cordyceps fumosorosea ARSEF 2679]|uniref:S33 family peptidase n=1 Tax=Cordyceps fumosorosea (strain ARSEF 2679) TaxID=1081104 RepID=A0A162IFK5_CORFA|nr:S33 family peptidase [Cordyceps fumosorosea ARSEF 2679]OAA56445.1 S33 family peptidase [Cordyceps fumosorosea ARSEF 2679]